MREQVCLRPEACFCKFRPRNWLVDRGESNGTHACGRNPENAGEPARLADRAGWAVLRHSAPGTAMALGLLVLVNGACASNSGGNATGGSGASSVGHRGNPSTHRVALTRGRFSAPVTHQGWTAHEAARVIYHGGLNYNNGIIHRPNWVSCSGDSQKQVSTRFVGFRCRVQVHGVASYELYLKIREPNHASFRFLHWLR